MSSINTDREALAMVSEPVPSGHDCGIAIGKMTVANTGVGIAAIQVGLAVRVIQVKTKHMRETILNPEYTVVGKAKRTSREGCLSVPEVGIVRKIRHYCVVVTGFTPDWQPYRRTCKGLEAAVVQHEIDHLNGVLICD